MIKQISKRIKLGRRVIPNTSGRPDLYGSFEFAQFGISYLISEKLYLENTFLEINSRPSPSYNILEMIIGSSHGFGEERRFIIALIIIYDLSVFPDVCFLLVKVKTTRQTVSSGRVIKTDFYPIP